MSTSTSSRNVPTPCRRGGRANIDSATALPATTTSQSETASTSGAIPAVGRKEPSRPSSAIKAILSIAEGWMTSCATRRPIAIARSIPAPPLRSAVPARLMVIRRLGHSRPLDNNAARTRSLDSRHPSSGRPTTVNAGMPTPTCDSTTMGAPRVPSKVADRIAAYMCSPLRSQV